MEPKISQKQRNKNENIVNIIYIFDEDKKYEDKMEIKFREDEDNKTPNIISYEEIKKNFEYFLYEKQKKYEENEEENEKEFYDVNSNNIIYEYIRYFNGEGWSLLEENSFIIVNEDLTLDIIKIMIKAKILDAEENKIHKKFENIGKEMNKIKTDIDDIDKGYFKDSHYLPFNSIILTSNPLLSDKGQEFRTMNDFNIIPATLYNLFNENSYLKYSKFGVLTQAAFIKALSNKELDSYILHLICKSTYNIDDEKNNLENIESVNYVNLIFEQENSYNCEFINEKKLTEILSKPEIKENIKKITLIISTQLSQDVFNIFNKFEFKNILIQHTTLADTEFIANLNKKFYENLILNRLQNLDEIFNDALNININPDITTFCCCFHEHVINCNFLKNLNNELYNNDNTAKKSLNELKEALPHFCHLKFECANVDPSCNLPEDFCRHIYYCLKSFNINIEKDCTALNKRNKKGGYNNGAKFSTCCCYDKNKKIKDNIQHHINTIFSTKHFTTESINDKNSIIKINLQESYIPQYEKMILFVGKNRDFANIINYLYSYGKFFNIYGDTVENLKIFINAFIEYYKERNYLSQSYGNDNKEKKHIILDEFNIENFKKEHKHNIIYFIYIQDPKLIQIIEEVDINYKIINYKVILLSEKKIDDKKFENIKINEEPFEPLPVSEKKDENETEYIPNSYVKYQHKITVRKIWEI